jgi:endonuclease YncB( thermonuclease family)
MLRRLATGLLAIVTFGRRAEPLTGPAKVLDGDTIIVAEQLVRLHGIDAPELDQTFWWRGQQIACGTMSLAALEALIAGVKVRCEVIERDRHGRLVANCGNLCGCKKSSTAMPSKPRGLSVGAI